MTHNRETNGATPIDWREYGGFIVEARDARSHPIVGYGKPVKPADPERGSHSCNEAWRDLLHECRYQDGFVMNGGLKMEVRRGELVGAISWLANRWNWTPKTVRVFLDRLERDGMISRFRSDTYRDTTEVYQGNRTGNQASIISVTNYELFNAPPEVARQAQGQSRGNQAAIEGQSRGNSTKDKQTNKGTNEQESPNQTRVREDELHPPPIDKHPDDIARQAYLDGLRIKQGVATKGARGAQRVRGELDGTHGIRLDEDGKLTVMNGARAALVRDFPGVNLESVCNKAVPDIIKFSYPTALDAVSVLRKHAQWESERKSGHGKATTGGDPIKQMRALVEGKR
jgi:hypothetical protein